MKSVKKLENLKSELFSEKIKIHEKKIIGGSTGCTDTSKFGTLDAPKPDIILN